MGDETYNYAEKVIKIITIANQLGILTFYYFCSFHALKDEAFIRHSLQRQAATLHHATVGYTVSYHSDLAVVAMTLYCYSCIRYKELPTVAMKKEYYIQTFLNQNHWLVQLSM